MKKSIAANYIYNTAYQILLLITPLITTPYISRVLGVTNVGIFSYTYTVAYYFVVFSQLGLNLYGKKEISSVRDNRSKLTLIFKQLMCLRVLLFVIGAVIYTWLIIISSTYRIYYIVFGMYYLASMVDITWFFQGLEEFKTITIRNFIIKIINICLIFVFVKISSDLAKYIFLYSMCEFISQFILWTRLPKMLDKTPLTTENILKHVRATLSFFAPQAVTTVYTLANKLMLGALGSVTEVGLYAQSEKIVRLTLSIIGSMGTVIMPRIANMYANQNSNEEIKKILEKSIKWCWLIGVPMVFGLIGISNNFTTWFFGAGYEPVSDLMCIISPIIILIGLSDVFGMQYLLPTNQVREYTWCAALGAITNVILNAILISKLGAIGVSIATVVSEFAVTVLMYYYVLKTIRLKAYPPLVYFGAGIIMCVVIKLIDFNLPPRIYSTFIDVFVGSFIYFGFIFLCKDQFLHELYCKLSIVLQQRLKFNITK